jgi:hypothetical protein
MVSGNCALCSNDAELQLSHIIPQFVFTWLKESAPGKIRNNRMPNRLIQDGEKEHLLCADCEGLFSGWESTFHRELFVPLHSSLPVTQPIHYGPWALKFAVSVSWRVLSYYCKVGLSHFSVEQKIAAEEALSTWRSFLLGEMSALGPFEQHLLPLDAIVDYSGPTISPFFNRYLLRSVHMDVLASETSAIVYSKLCRLIVFGFIREDNPEYWRGMKLHCEGGTIEPRDYLLPKQIADYMDQKANQTARIFSSLSPRQKRKTRKLINEHLDEIAGSETFRAMYYDVAHSGRTAFEVTEPDEGDTIE